MDTDKLKALAEELKAKADEILACCGEDYEEEESSEEESSDEPESEDKPKEKSGAVSGKNLAVLIALKKKMGK